MPYEFIRIRTENCDIEQEKAIPFFGLGCTVTMIVWNFFVNVVRGFFEFPLMLQLIWAFVVPALLVAVIWSILETRAEKDPPLTAQEKILAANEVEGFEEVFRTKSHSADGEAHIVTQLQRKPQNPDGSLTFGVARVHDASQTRFEWTIFVQDKTWAVGSNSKFDTIVGSGIGIEKALDQQHLRASVSKALDVLCVGLASSEKNQREPNETLSHSRALHLCRALINLKHIDEQRQGYLAISYGEAKPPDDDTTDLAAQRTAIIVGVTQYSGSDNEDSVLATIARLLESETPIQGVRLQNYSLFGEPYKMWAFGGGALEGYDAMTWTSDDKKRKLGKQSK